MKTSTASMAITLAFTLPISTLALADGDHGTLPNDGRAKTSEGFSYEIGAMAITGSELVGADDTETRVRPYGKITYHIDTEQQISFNPGGLNYSTELENDTKLSLGLQYKPGREESSSDSLTGMGDLDDSFVFNPKVTWSLDNNIQLSSSLSTGLSGDYGNTINLAATKRGRISKGLMLSGGINATFADDQHMQSYYGVTAAQAATSGKQAYTPDAGMSSYGANASLMYKIAPQTSAVLKVNHTILTGDADSSPVTEASSATTTTFGIIYRF